jgi:hypothetical protein
MPGQRNIKKKKSGGISLTSLLETGTTFPQQISGKKG